MDWFRQSIDTSATSVKKRTGFNDKMVKNLSIAQIYIGFLSMLFGFVVEISGALIRNNGRWHSLRFSMLGTGMWCGLIFIGAGYFGIETVRRKSTCFIVALMALAMSTFLFAVLQMTISICAMIGDRHQDNRYHEDSIPIVPFLFNLLLTLLGFFMVIILCTTVVYLSFATCCQSQPNYLRVNIYEPVRTPSTNYPQPMQISPQMPYTNPGQTYYTTPPQGYEETAKGEMQPLVLMPINQFVPAQYHNSNFPSQPTQFTSSSQQTISNQEQTTAASQNVV